MGEEEEEGPTLGFIPTWVVAVVVTVIIAISLILERCLYFTGKYLERKNQKSLFEALQRVKEELMLLGFISLLLTVFQGAISKICISEKMLLHMLPCSSDQREETEEEKTKSPQGSKTHHTINIVGRVLAEESLSQHRYCAEKNKVPFLSVEALHHLHIFIFVLAVVHLTFSLLTVIFGGLQIRQWKVWEDTLAKENYDTDQVLKRKVTHVHLHDFIKDRALVVGEKSVLRGWVRSFFKQFHASVTKTDYLSLRLGFIMTHCRTNLKFNFHKYMMRALEDDFQQVVGISWYLWLFVILFLLLNVNGWNTYFWIAFIPVLLLLAVGTKLEHIITQLADEVADRHVVVEGEVIVQPSDEHFWFHRPQIVLILIHFILFQNAFEIAYFFWILFQYGFHSCIMGQAKYIIARLIIGVFIQVLCSYSTLPLYAIVTQMGSHYKKAIFDQHIQAGLLSWAQKARQKKKGILKAGTRSIPLRPTSIIISDGHTTARPPDAAVAAAAAATATAAAAAAAAKPSSDVDDDDAKTSSSDADIELTTTTQRAEHTEVDADDEIRPAADP